MGICDGRVAVITGAGRGIGREYALEFARQGAKVVVNDLGGERDGTGADASPAAQVVAEIRALGGDAVADGGDVSDWDDAKRMIDTAIDTYGSLDILVSNAGILRDRALVNMTEQEWDGVIRVHLRGTFAPARHAAAYWRAKSKAGEAVDGRLITTSSSTGLFGNIGQTNYAAAKAGIAAFTVTAAKELGRYGVTANCVYPGAASRLTADLTRYEDSDPESEARSPASIAPLVVWLGSPESTDITGRVFGTRGHRITVAEGWRAGPYVDGESRWDPAELGKIVPGLVAEAQPNATFPMGETPSGEDA
ncbi:MAG TPA: SDR family oxidoreductase [Streptosporangiaceae bacterium]|jgi:NAD(P)-dependent dehydrogenase (short-subunit alcohol dehydrogenase family)